MRVAEFSLDTLLYEGSHTLVYGGVREADGVTVVGKLVADGGRALTHEYLLLQKVAGPGVVEVFGVFDGSDGPVLIQRRFGAGSLADELRGGRFTVPRALRVALQLAQVCARVHAARIVHRDIKPANILYDPETEAIALGDFGIAVELPVNARALPVGDLVGTPSYVSPEHTGRTEASEVSGRGVGLGALAEVCRAMGCEISVDSTPGQGTTMRFELSGALAKARRERQVSRELRVVPLADPIRPEPVTTPRSLRRG